MRVNEIFTSIQGEGYWAGCPAVFIRLSGCNLNPPCPWCDTNHQSYTPMTSYELLDRIFLKTRRYKAKKTLMIVWTGGEPLLQLNEYEGMGCMRILRDQGYYQAVETNGTLSWFSIFDYANWITVSPKPDAYDMKLRGVHEVKVVYTRDLNQTGFDNMIQYIDANYNGPKFIQPRSNENIQETANWLLEHTNGWRLSLQMHKIANLA